MKVAVVAICYNAYSDTIKFLNSIHSASEKVNDLDLEVIVCDNSTNGTGLEELSSEILNYGYRYIKLDNVGYFPAFFKGFKALNDSDQIDWDFVIVSNVDLLIDGDFFVNLNNCEFSRDVGVVAPSIISKQTNEDINPKIFKRPKRNKLLMLYFGFQRLWFYKFYVWLSINRAKRRGKKQTRGEAYPSGTVMYAAHGSLMIFTSSYLEKGASLDYPRFLFGEEVFVAEEARLKKLLTVYSPELKVYDNEHGSTSKEAEKFISLEHVKSYDQLLRKYF